MKTVQFDRNGGTLAAEVRNGFGQPGSYTLYVWEAGVNRIVQEEHGNFLNPDDDRFELALPAAANDGRIVEALVSQVLTPPMNDYAAVLVVTQAGKVLGGDESTGRGQDFQTVQSDLYVKLQAI